MKIERWEIAAISAVLVLALVLRLMGLNAGLWYDEVFTLTHFVRLPWTELVQDFSSLNNHMFYSLQAKAAVSAFGESAWALRLPALLFGMGSLVVMWLIGRDAAGRAPAMLATLLIAVSYHHVWFTQNARGYTGILFWCTLATLFLIRNLEAPNWRRAFGYAIPAALAVYTHLSAGFFLVAHGVVYLAAVALDRVRPLPYPGLRDWKPFVGFVGAGVLMLLLHLPILGQVGGAMGKVSGGSGVSSMAEWENPFRTLQEITGSLGPLGPLAPVGLIAALVLIVWGAALVVRRNPLFGVIYLVQIPLSLALLAALSFRIWPRYFFVDIGFVLLCLSAGVFALSDLIARTLRRPKLSPILAGLATVAGLGASAVLLVRNYEAPKQDFEGAVASVQRQLRPGDAAAAVGLAAEPMHAYFAPSWPTPTTAAQLAALEAPGRTVFVVTAFGSNLAKENPQVAALLERRYVISETRPGTLGGGEVRIWRSKP